MQYICMKFTYCTIAPVNRLMFNNFLIKVFKQFYGIILTITLRITTTSVKNNDIRV